MEIETHTSSSDGCEIAVFESGQADGIEVVFLHGFALDHRIWERQLADSRLVSTCRLIAIDLRGHGVSAKPDQRDAYVDGSIWADDLAAVFKHKGLRRPVVVAWSFAGRMINDYVKRYGQSQLAGINYIAAASINDIALVGPDHTLLAALCSESVPEAEAAAHSLIAKLFHHAPGSPAHEQIYQTIAKIPSRFRAYLRSRPLEYDEMLPSLSIPVLAIHGALDTFVLPGLSRRLAGIVQRGECSIYASAGHAPFFDDPARFNSELLAFANAVTR